MWLLRLVSDHRLGLRETAFPVSRRSKVVAGTATFSGLFQTIVGAVARHAARGGAREQGEAQTPVDSGDAQMQRPLLWRERRRSGALPEIATPFASRIRGRGIARLTTGDDPPLSPPEIGSTSAVPVSAASRCALRHRDHGARIARWSAHARDRYPHARRPSGIGRPRLVAEGPALTVIGPGIGPAPPRSWRRR
jgi:hypothetical protein